MKVSKETDKRDTRKAQQRYIDQPGQWVDTTPKALKARQDKGFKALAASVKKRESEKQSTKQAAKKAK